MATGSELRPVSDSAITIDEQRGVLPKNYAWWADMIYVPFPDGKKILVIAKHQESPGNFDRTFTQIHSTFKFQ